MMTAPTSRHTHSHKGRTSSNKGARRLRNSLDTLEASELYLQGEISAQDYDDLIRSRIAGYHSTLQSLARDRHMKSRQRGDFRGRIHALFDALLRHREMSVL